MITGEDPHAVVALSGDSLAALAEEHLLAFWHRHEDRFSTSRLHQPTSGRHH
jgi:hypothetical protein